MASFGPGFDTLRWEGEASGRLLLLDQTELPEREVELVVTSTTQLIDAVRRLAVRGAPALGCAGAYGAVLAAREAAAEAGPAWRAALEEKARRLIAARPTAVNLEVGVERVLDRARKEPGSAAAPPLAALLAAARAFHEEDAALCRAIGEHGSALLGPKATLLTHCNAGALATGGSGTALSVIYAAHALGKDVAVYADETRPLLQGARLTAWELQRAGVPVTLLCDGAAAAALAAGRIQAVIVGSDRIAANGDVANKIGTYGLAVLAREHGVPFYVAAPTTTIDPACPDGAAIPIEERDGDEVRAFRARGVAPPGIAVWNPAFDVTPARLVTALITERGVLRHPDRAGIAALLADKR